MSSDLISRARAGDGEAFRALTDPHRRELQVHCYRMLGSMQDAEDALQDTMLSAWQGLAGFGGQASIRTWLYRIATNKCLNAMRAARRRPAKAWDIPGVEPPEPTRIGEAVWLGPFPDALLDGALAVPVGPEARYEQTESISLAFVAALQALPPRQLAVLVLRDVLGFHADEVAVMVEATVASVNSALTRARANLARHRTPPQNRPSGALLPQNRASGAGSPQNRPARAGSPEEEAIVARFVQAYEAADVAALVELFTDDVFLSMPPMPLEYQGRDVAGRFFERLLIPGRRYRLVPTRANGAPAFGSYVRGPGGELGATGLFAVTVADGHIVAMTRFENTVLGWFGLPQELPGK